MTEAFNFENALKAIQSGQSITGKDGVIIAKLLATNNGRTLTTRGFSQTTY